MHPLLVAYLVKAGAVILRIKTFNEDLALVRLLFVFLSMIGVILIYFLVRRYQGKSEAVLVLAFVCFSQFHLGISRLIFNTNILLLFNAAALLLFFKAIGERKGTYLYLLGIIIGLGCLAKETIILLIPIFLIFLVSQQECRNWFKRKELYLCLIVIGLLVLPPIIWNYSHDWVNYKRHLDKAHGLGLSAVSVSLYAGQLIMYPLRAFGEDTLDYICSAEIPFEFWPLGIICLAGAVFWLVRKEKTRFVKFLLLNFFFIFAIFSFIRVRGYLHLDDSWQASLSFFPAVILGASMLAELSRKYNFMRIITPLLIAGLLVNAVFFVDFPANYFAPCPRLKFKELSDAREIYVNEGKLNKVKKIDKYIKTYFSDFVNKNNYEK